MAKELHHRKLDDTYALYSTVVDDYVTEFKSKKEIHDIWLLDLIEEQMEKVNRYMEEIDKEV